MMQSENGMIESFASSPPAHKAEQEAIAEALSDADALIESLEQLIAKKRHLKQGAMQELLTGKKRLPGFNGKWERTPSAMCDILQRGQPCPTHLTPTRLLRVVYSLTGYLIHPRPPKWKAPKNTEQPVADRPVDRLCRDTDYWTLELRPLAVGCAVCNTSNDQNGSSSDVFGHLQSHFERVRQARGTHGFDI